MNETRAVGGAVFAVAGALLLGAVALLIVWVLDLPGALAAVLLVAAVIAGAWYGWRLPKGMQAGRSRRDSGHGHD